MSKKHLTICLPDKTSADRIKSVKVKAEMPRPAWDDDALLWALGGGCRLQANGEHQEEGQGPHPCLYYLLGHRLTLFSY